VSDPAHRDLEGNQAVDTLFYNARELDERYSATDNHRRAAKPLPHDRNAAHFERGRAMLSIVGRHLRSRTITWRHARAAIASVGEFGISLRQAPPGDRSLPLTGKGMTSATPSSSS